MDWSRYTIVIDGEVTGDLRDALSPLSVSASGGRTRLVSPPMDQVGLQAVLARLADLGLRLLSVSCEPDAIEPVRSDAPRPS